MAYFPSLKPFYDPDKEQEIYRKRDGNLKVRSQSPSPPDVIVQGTDPGSENERPHKLEPRWTRHVLQDQGDLFYIDAGSKSGIKEYSSPDYHASRITSAAHSGVNGLLCQDGVQNSNGAFPFTDLSQSKSVEEYEGKLVQTQAETHKKSEQLRPNKKERTIDKEVICHGNFRNTIQTTKGISEWKVGKENNSRALLWENGTPFDATNDMTNCNDVDVAHSEQPQKQQRLNGRQLKDISLIPDLSKRKFDLGNGKEKASGAELFELLFGIVLCRYNQRPTSGTGIYTGMNGQCHNQKERKIVVQSIVPGSAADRSERIHRGDMLVHINGQEVTWSNLLHLVQTVRKEVKLTFQVPKIIGPTSCSSSSNNNGVSRQPAYYNLCARVTGCDIHATQQQLLQHLCAAMYLTLPSSDNETSAQDDIVYCFPPQEEKLTAIRGVFLTLSSSLQDIVCSGAKSSCLQIGTQQVNVVYHQQGRDVFVLTAEAQRVPLSLLHCIKNKVRRMLCTVFGDVDRAFRNGDSEQLNQMFALLFHHLLCQRDVKNDNGCVAIGAIPEGPYSHLALHALFGTPMLLLSEENRLICDEILNEFEAVDFDDFLEDNELYSRRSYLVLGCSLYFKNYLVCSHLHDSDLQDVESFLQCHCLLTLAARQPLDELVVWQEVHLNRKQSASVAAGSSSLGYQEHSGRWFMLIVGMKHFLLATLLEAGSCCQEPRSKCGPHPLYVNQARATLIQLDTEEVHMSTCCQDRLNQDQESPLVTGAGKFVTWGRQGREDGTFARSLSSKPPSPARAASDSVFKFKSSPRTEHKSGLEADTQPDKNPVTQDTGVIRRQGSKLSYGSNDSGGSGSSAGAPKSKSSRFSSLLDIASIGRSMSALHIDTIGNQSSSGLVKLTRGRDNTLFHFIYHRESEGMLVTPANLDLTYGDGNIQMELLSNFHRCVLQIRAEFQSKNRLQQEKEKESLSPFRREHLLTKNVHEHGVLFHFQSYSTTANSDRRQLVTLFYWVIGRQYLHSSNQDELYVCFHESTSQNLVEMAFSLGFGC